MSEVEGTRQVVEGLAHAREEFLTLARWLQSQARVRQVASGMDARFYGGVAFWECFVEAELDTGNAVCWWMDLREADGHWVVEPSVLIQHGDGQDGLDTKQPRAIRTDREFRALLDGVVAELVGFPERALERALGW